MTDHALALFLRALALVESGGNPAAVGGCGERGAFQMLPAVATECGGYGAREAARKVRLLERELLHAGIDPQPFNLALAWNAGAGAVIRGQAPVVSYQHAGRVRALYELSFSRQPQSIRPASAGDQSPGSSAARGGKIPHTTDHAGAALGPPEAPGVACELPSSWRPRALSVPSFSP